MDGYLRGLKISIDDPALLLDWEVETLNDVVLRANGINNIPLPPWITTAAEGITASSLVNDIVSFLATHAGGRRGKTVLAPNSLDQAFNIITLLSYIEREPFMQDICKQLPPSSVLANIYKVTDNRVASATPVIRAEHNASRKLFS